MFLMKKTIIFFYPPARDAIRMEFYNPQSDSSSSNPIRNPSGWIQKSGDPSRSNPEFGDFFFLTFSFVFPFSLFRLSLSLSFRPFSLSFFLGDSSALWIRYFGEVCNVFLFSLLHLLKIGY
jgi:hypothetical protein